MESTVIVGSFNFMRRLELYKTTKPYSIAFEIESWTGDVPRSNFQQDCVDITIEDIRGREGQFTFEKNGFALLDFSSSMTYEDFENTAKLENVYAQELGACLLQYFQATSVCIFSILVCLHYTAIRPDTDQWQGSSATSGISKCRDTAHYTRGSASLSCTYW